MNQAVLKNMTGKNAQESIYKFTLFIEGRCGEYTLKPYQMLCTTNYRKT
jgi:hypothetical protein